MAISTIYQTPKSSKSKFIMPVAIVLGVAALGFFGYLFVKNMTGLVGKSALSIDSFYGEHEVFVNDESVGTTPYSSEDSKAGETKIKIKGDNVEYEISLNLLANSEVVVKRDLGVSQVFSGGQNFWLEKDRGDNVLSIISDPSEADVYLDGTKVGTTPYTSSDLTPGDYELKLEAPGYEAQSARIDISEGYKLNASFALFPSPVPATVSLLEGSTNLYDVYSDSLIVTSNASTWAKAVVYWNETRGVNLSGVGINKDLVFDYFLDYKGNLYDSTGNQISIEDNDVFENAEKGAYLRLVSDGAGLSQDAKDTFLVLGDVGTSLGKATILETGLGWLKVREAPVSGAELTKVNVGESFTVLEEADGWIKIKVSDDVEGWVSGTYVEIE